MKVEKLPLSGMHAAITGAGSGIGRAIALELSSLGANVSLYGRRKAKLLETQKLLSKAIKSSAIACDVSDEKSVNAAFLKATKVFGKIQILVNNAGSVESKTFVSSAKKDWKQTIETNLSGVLICTGAVLASMEKAKYGRIINISSTAGLKGYPYVAAYCAAKHGVIGFTKALALEVATTGITVNAVCPGFTDTDLLKSSVTKVSKKTKKTEADIHKIYLRNVPLGRFIRPDEVAELVAWLAKKEQAALTGQTFVIDGGELH